MPPRHTLRGWILQCEELARGPMKYQTHEIIFEMDSNMPVDENANKLRLQIHESFNRLIDWDNGDCWRISRMAIVGADGEEHPITLRLLAAHLLDLTEGPLVAKPDLLGYGTNKLRTTRWMMHCLIHQDIAKRWEAPPLINQSGKPRFELVQVQHCSIAREDEELKKKKKVQASERSL
ncbi:hypothetical protein LshimejAT787_0111840 [Lyophyllum shimeji]|uniref:Uncharacterized protein n=1 Tax=Lyophyllum shimeji TaxID=47721 RepID=A0A9P3UKB2_LYOSH|nr:hypothetical protein LshimejAT787_0111840 [Lyophyllum shimeji]